MVERQATLFDKSRHEPYIPLRSPHSQYRLTPFRTTDVDAVIHILNQPEVYTHLLTPYPYQREHAQGFISEQRRRYEADRQYFTGDAVNPIKDGKTFDYGPMLAVREVQSDGPQLFLGVAGIWRSLFLYETDEGLKEECKRKNDAKLAGDSSITYSVAYYLDPACHGKGIMTVAIRELIHSWAIPYMNAHDITVGITEDHLSSRRVLEKVGFKMVGELEGVTPMQRKRKSVLGQWVMQYTAETTG
ncbi:hypothetical protein CALCODRAFT_445643 [Calocera cornea HHB12733]|uniref:N-acetyltransferase domain-containing protein n=1 Tax=Calocera cornea HHB12733 TaxID=1353952 RepID=A0A165K3E9_9BASI|nr:hypothetical protein CALCODRAFT_445643 [Calocera cornea HHB12733]